MEGENS